MRTAPLSAEERAALANTVATRAGGKPIVRVPPTPSGAGPGAYGSHDGNEADLAAPPEPPKLHPAALHGPAGDFVRIVGPHSEADPAALLVQALVAFGNAAGRSAHVQVSADKHYSNLFALLIGGTSRGRKGSAWSEVARLFGEVDDEWRHRHVSSGLSSGEGLIWAVRDPIERQEPVKEKGRVVEYQTVQSDPGVPDKRLLVIETEFSSVLKVAAREGNILSAVMRQAWDSGTLRGLSKNNPACATDAHISIIGHVTGEELCRYLDHTEAANGFANRFLFVAVRRSKLLPEGGALDARSLGTVARQFVDALDFTRRVGCLGRDADAADLWRLAYPLLTEGRPGLLGAATGRAEAQALRLSLLYALLDGTPAIGRAHLEAALAVWDYCAASAGYVLGDSLGDPTADELLRILRAAPDGLTTTEIRNHFSRHGNYATALSRLEGLGLVRRESRRTPGRSEILWYATKATGATLGDGLSLRSLLSRSQRLADAAPAAPDQTPDTLPGPAPAPRAGLARESGDPAGFRWSPKAQEPDPDLETTRALADGA